MRLVVAFVVALLVSACAATPISTEDSAPSTAAGGATGEVVEGAVEEPGVATTVPEVPDPSVEAGEPLAASAPPEPSPSAPATPPGGLEAAGTGTLEATTQERGVGYTLNVNSDGSVVRWDPCTPIRWQVNLALAPPGALDALRVAFDDLAAATGLTFTSAGTTTAVPTRSWLQSDGERGTLLVAWVPKVGSDLWSGSADGEGGWYKRGVSTDGTSWTWKIERGFVLIDPATTAGYAAGFAPGVSLGALLLHELAHAIGLGHTDDDAQLMYPTLSSSTAAGFSRGDRDGLARLGRDSGCIR
jgi:hypothetical protein